MKQIDYLLILAVLVFVSCGKSSKEIQAEQQSRKQAEQEADNGLSSRISAEGQSAVRYG